MLYDFVSLGQLFIFTVITIHLVILCKRKKPDQVAPSEVTPQPPAPIPVESKTESVSASSPAKMALPATAPSATAPTPTNVGSVTKQNSVKVSKSSAPVDSKMDAQSKRQQKSLNAAFNERLKEDQSAGVSETV